MSDQKSEDEKIEEGLEELYELAEYQKAGHELSKEEWERGIQVYHQTYLLMKAKGADDDMLSSLEDMLVELQTEYRRKFYH